MPLKVKDIIHQNRLIGDTVKVRTIIQRIPDPDLTVHSAINRYLGIRIKSQCFHCPRMA